MFLLTFGAVVLFNSATTTQAAEVSDSIQPGNTIWYNVEEATNLEDFLPTDDDGGGISGSLVGSQIYVKVMNVQKETLTYYDGSVIKTGLVPTVDIAVGGLLGQSITLHVPNNDTGVVEDVVLPAGAGLPFPINFGTVTLFNVTDMPESVLPLPLILNDDYAMHEAVANEAKAALAGEGWDLTIVNDDAEFSLDARLEDPDNNDFVDFVASWAKEDGLLRSLTASIDVNGTAGNMKITYDHKEYKPLKLKVGDKWSLAVDDVGFDYELAGFSAEEQVQASGNLTEAQNAVAAANGQTLFDFEVQEIDGLYYSVDGSTYDGESNSMMPLEDDLWMTGFGTLNYQVGKLAFFAGIFGGGDDDGSSESESFGPTLSQDDDLSDEDARRLISPPGFAITEDWAVYEAFDFSISAVVEGYESLLVEALASETDIDGTLDISYDGSRKDGGYELSASVDFDLSGPTNASDPTSPTVSVDVSVDAKMVYDKYGIFESFEISGSGSIRLTTGEFVSINNARLKLVSEFESVEPLTDNVGDDGNDAVSGDDDAGPGLDVPGFDFYLAMISIISLGFIIRKRRY